MRSLTDLEIALATYGGLSYLLSLPFWYWWDVSITTWFYLWWMYYLCTLVFIIIQWKDTLQYSSLHSCDSISFLLSIFPLYACENYLSRKLYFMCFFLASLLISLKLLFWHGINTQGSSTSIGLRIYFFLCMLVRIILVAIFISNVASLHKWSLHWRWYFYMVLEHSYMVS